MFASGSSRRWRAVRLAVVLLQVCLLLFSAIGPAATLAVEPVPSADPSAPADPSPSPDPAPSVDPSPTAAPDPTPTIAPDPTPTTAPDPTPAPTPDPTPDPTVAPSGPPSIASDKADYAPGELVTLTGSGWQPGEEVHIYVNDDWGSTWTHDAYVLADAQGQITDQFNLPNWFVAHYSVLATGLESGAATAGFTDGNVNSASLDIRSSGAGPTCGSSSTSFVGGATVCAHSTIDTTTSGTGDIWVLWFNPSGTQVLSTSHNGLPGASFNDFLAVNVVGAWTVKVCTNSACPSNQALTSKTFTITPANINTTTSAPSKTATYGSTNVTLTATVTPASGPSVNTGTVTFTVNGTSVTSGTVSSGLATATFPLAGVNVGSYAISAVYNAGSGLNGSNNSAQSPAPDLDITARPVTVTADGQSKTYGDADPALTYQVTAGSLVGTDAFTGSLTRAAGENVGSYAITQGTLALSTNYALTYVGANLAIGPSVLTVRADNKTKELGSGNPAFTATFTDFKNGETLATSGVTGEPGFTTTATTGSPVGSYPITVSVGTLTSENYSFAFVNGTLNVVYRFDGFLQPINDTAHEQGCSSPCPISVFKAGSTVPVKFDLKKSDGTLVSATALPRFVGPVKGGPTSQGIDESVYTDPPTSGTTFTVTGGHYQYNWSTKGLQAGYYYRIGALLDDGTTHYVYIGLK